MSAQAELLGAYVFCKRLGAAEAGGAAPTEGLTLPRSAGHVLSTVSHFNLIHVKCHDAARRADSNRRAAKRCCCLWLTGKVGFHPCPPACRWLSRVVDPSSKRSITFRHQNAAFLSCMSRKARTDVVLIAAPLLVGRAEEHRVELRREWEGATLRNSGTRANNLLPLRGRDVPEAAYAAAVATFWEHLPISASFRTRSSGA